MNYFKIDDYNPISKNFIIPKDFVPIRRYKPEEVLSKDAINKFLKLEFKLREVQLFTTLPYKFTTIHIDGNDMNSKSAVNYVVNGIGKMIWYNLNVKKTASLVTSADTAYIPVSLTECTKIEEVCIDKLTLIDISKPHNIFNNTKFFRYCFSIRYNQVEFNLAKNKFANWKNLNT